MADPHEHMAPGFTVSIADTDLGRGLTQLVKSLEYESVDGIADEARLTISNPELVLADSSLWHPGNEMDMWFGYGAQLGHVGRVIIVKPEPTFPRGEEPTITIKGYTKDQLMMQNTPATDKSGVRDFEAIFIHDAVGRVAQSSAYNFDTLDIDETPGRYASAQKADMSDYEFVKGLSNLTGYLFWVDFSLPKEGGTGWTLHFRNPEVLADQENTYTFEYNRGDSGTLLDFRPEVGADGAVTKLQAHVRNPESGKTFIVEFEDSEETPDSKYKGNPDNIIDEKFTTAGAVVKLFWGDYALEVVADKQFTTEADLRWWAQQWFRRRREDFIIGRGSTIGVADIRARQSHKLTGLAKSLDGGYYWPRARHIFNSTDGYLIDFTARKEF